MRYSDYGPSLLEHLLLSNHNVPINTKKKDFDEKNIDAAIISAVLQETRDFLVNNQAKGFILQKVRTAYFFPPFLFRAVETEGGSQGGLVPLPSFCINTAPSTWPAQYILDPLAIGNPKIFIFPRPCSLSQRLKVIQGFDFKGKYCVFYETSK